MKSTPKNRILYKQHENLKLECYIDVDYVGALTERRLTSGYYTLLGGNLVTWRSKKQNVVSRSSAEAKFISIAFGISELLWMKNVLGDLRIKWDKPMRLYCNNKSVIGITHNPMQYYRTKHMEEVDRHFIKEKLDSRLICTPHVPTGGQLANILVKGVQNPLFGSILDKLEIKDLLYPA